MLMRRTEVAQRIPGSECRAAAAVAAAHHGRIGWIRFLQQHVRACFRPNCAEPGHGNSHHSAAGLLANEATLLYSRVVLLTAMVTTSNSFRVSNIQLRCQPRTVYLSLYLILPIDVIYFP